jgi:ribosomal protein L29
MKYAELKEKTDAELKELLATESAALREFRFKIGVGQMKAFHKIAEAKKTVAQIQTILKERARTVETK